MANWTDDLETKIFSVVKYNLIEILKTKYQNIKFTTTQSDATGPSFPTVYIHMLPMIEQGQDLENDKINSVLATVQVEVKTNSSQSDAKRVINFVLEEFKRMRFSIVSMPEFTKEGELYRSIMRARRAISSDDNL